MSLFHRGSLKKSCSSAVLLALLCLIGSAAAAEPTRLGVFWLFNLKTIKVEAVEHSLPLELDGASARHSLEPRQTLFIERAERHLRLRLLDQRGRMLAAWSARSVNLGATDSMQAATLTVPGKITRTFRGPLAFTLPQSDSTAPVTGIRVILTTKTEAAVASAVAAEMPRPADAAALAAFKAQAVMARTFMASHPRRHPDAGYDFCDSTHCQLYRGEDLAASTLGQLARQATAETAGLRLTFQNQPIRTYFTAACGGLTAAPATAWGTVLADAYSYPSVRCDWCRASKYYRWERQLEARQLFGVLNRLIAFKLTARAEIKTITDPQGFVTALRVIDGAAPAVLPIAQVRHAIGSALGWNNVISNAFTLERQGSAVRMRGRGFGHNVGLCLEGALGQALAGRDWRSILKFYFPGAEITEPATATVPSPATERRKNRMCLALLLNTCGAGAEERYWGRNQIPSQSGKAGDNSLSHASRALVVLGAWSPGCAALHRGLVSHACSAGVYV